MMASTEFESAVDRYQRFGVDAKAAVEETLRISVSVHCWQGDDVRGFEVHEGNVDSGGILATGGYRGAAQNIDQLRSDLEKALSLCPGKHRINLHAIYADCLNRKIDRADLAPEQFFSWFEWAKSLKIKLDFNPTYFAHPLAKDGMTLSHQNEEVRAYWIRHGIACRRIADHLATLQDDPCVNNHWVPDGMKDSPVDRWSPRSRLRDSLDEVFAERLLGCDDAVESKLFGLRVLFTLCAHKKQTSLS
jgi:L-rhamnose isomerase